MTERVRVAARIRPLLRHESAQSCCVAPIDKSRICVGGKRVFSLDTVYNVDSTTEQIYEDHVRPLQESFCEGYNATVLAYGQTGTGKTYTVSNLVPMVLKDIFDRVSVRALSFSMLEVYGEVIRDVLVADPEVMKPLNLHDGSDTTGTYVIGASRVKVNTLDEALWLVGHGEKMRITAATGMNEHSSRSHLIFTIYNNEKMSKINLVDLAGSERNKKTLNIGLRFKESIGINTGLFALGNVIRALAQQKPTLHVPYRSSKLTRILQDALGGNSRTFFVACVAPGQANIDETTRTLQYSSGAMKIINEPVPNLDIIMARQQKALQRLQELSCCDSVAPDEDRDEFAAEQASEIRRLMALVQDLEEQLKAAKIDLRKDEIIFANKLRLIQQLTRENNQLQRQVTRRDQVQIPKHIDASPNFIPVGEESPTPTKKLEEQCASIANRLADEDVVVNKTMTPERRPRIAACSSLSTPQVSTILPQTPDESRNQQADDLEREEQLQSALKQSLLLKQVNEKLRRALEAMTSENKMLKNENSQLQLELASIHQLVGQGCETAQ